MSKEQEKKTAKAQDGNKTHLLQARVTQAQKDKAMRLGGAEWVRRMIDKAKEAA